MGIQFNGKCTRKCVFQVRGICYYLRTNDVPKDTDKCTSFSEDDAAK